MVEIKEAIVEQGGHRVLLVMAGGKVLTTISNPTSWDAQPNEATWAEARGFKAGWEKAMDQATQPSQEEYPQNHWTVLGAIKSARALIEAGNHLCFMAETSGGTAGRDDALCAAIALWQSERDKQKQMLRIIELEGHDPEIGAGVELLPAQSNVLRSLADDPAMVERVARALCIDDDVNPDDDRDGKPMWRLWIEDAQSVLRAIGGVE